jgi:tRNA1Val (adenine37-N6)-methyltransferase
MKVSTEACLMGAWVGTVISNPKYVLDIGTGTGLLSLMLAQNYPDASIEGVEIDEDSFVQTEQNFQQSPWNNRLKVSHDTVQNLLAISTSKYDLIISNPPFYEDYTPAQSASFNQAAHSTSLSQSELSYAVDQLLSKSGTHAVIYPPYQADKYIQIASKANLFPKQVLSIYNRKDMAVFRKIIVFDRSGTDLSEQSLYIRDQEGQYTQAFVDLLRAYYLYLDN